METSTQRAWKYPPENWMPHNYKINLRGFILRLRVIKWRLNYLITQYLLTEDIKIQRDERVARQIKIQMD